jgi:hypothetical protein
VGGRSLGDRPLGGAGSARSTWIVWKPLAGAWMPSTIGVPPASCTAWATAAPRPDAPPVTMTAPSSWMSAVTEQDLLDDGSGERPGMNGTVTARPPQAPSVYGALRRALAGGFCERLVIGGEEELLGWDLAAAGWRMSYVPQVVAHHCPPAGSGVRPQRRELAVRNALWAPWLRRPIRSAAWRTARELRRLRPDRTSARAVVRAAAGAPWVLRERRLSPPHVEAMRRQLDEQQLRSASRVR